MTLELLSKKLDALLSRQADRPRFLPLPQAALHAGLSLRSLKRVIRSGRVHVYRPGLGRRRVVVDRDELERYVLGSTA